MTISKRIKSLRDDNGWTQSQLAERSGLAQQTIQKIESGAVKNPRGLDFIATALGTTEQYLRYGDENEALPTFEDDKKLALSKRMKQRREELKLTQLDVSNATGLVPQTIQKVEAGIIRNPRKLDRIAEALSCTERWLRYGDGEQECEPKLKADRVELPYFASLPQALAQDLPSQKVPVYPTLLEGLEQKQISKVFVSISPDNSMAPWFVSGSEIGVLRQSNADFESGKAYIFKHGRIIRAAKIQATPIGYRLKFGMLSDMEDEALEGDLDDHIQIIGRVVWATHRFD